MSVSEIGESINVNTLTPRKLIENLQKIPEAYQDSLLLVSSDLGQVKFTLIVVEEREISNIKMEFQISERNKT